MTTLATHTAQELTRYESLVTQAGTDVDAARQALDATETPLATATAALDAFWSLVWAVATLLIAERMFQGALDTFRAGTRTMGLLALPYWWAVGFGGLAFAAVALAALAWVPRLGRGEG